MLLKEFYRNERRAMEQNRLTGKWCKFGRRDIRRLDFSIQKNILINTYKIADLQKYTDLYFLYCINLFEFSYENKDPSYMLNLNLNFRL